jgi:PadR family transcriptional regulator PadR
MPRDDTELSALEQRVLMAILRLNPNAYGISIQDKLQEVTGKEHSLGSIYAVLERLEEKGFIKSRTGEATAERGGRRKQHYVLAAEGEAALQEAMNTWKVLSRGIRLKGATA